MSELLVFLFTISVSGVNDGVIQVIYVMKLLKIRNNKRLTYLLFALKKILVLTVKMASSWILFSIFGSKICTCGVFNFWKYTGEVQSCHPYL